MLSEGEVSDSYSALTWWHICPNLECSPSPCACTYTYTHIYHIHTHKGLNLSSHQDTLTWDSNSEFLFSPILTVKGFLECLSFETHPLLILTKLSFILDTLYYQSVCLRKRLILSELLSRFGSIYASSHYLIWLCKIVFSPHSKDSLLGSLDYDRNPRFGFSALLLV